MGRVQGVLDVSGIALTTDWVGGSSLQLMGVARIDFAVRADGAGGTAVTAIDYRVVVSDTGAVGTWVPVPTVFSATGNAALDHSLPVTAGAASYARVMSSNHSTAPYCRLETRIQGGPAVAGDRSRADLSYVE